MTTTTEHASPSEPRSATTTSAQPPPSAELRPRINKWMFRIFSRYCVRYVRRHFHAVRLVNHTQPALGDRPAVIVLNHPAWWDPLIGILLASHLWPQRDHFAPIDSQALGRYRFFERLGFFGIEPHSARGARRFLSVSQAILAENNSALWITAQGTFADSRVRPIRLQNGVGHLADKLQDVDFVPLAIEYVFWTERLPEVLLQFGEPLSVTARDQLAPREWTDRIAARLEQAQDALAACAIERDLDCFQTLITGRAGVGGVYDAYRRIKARLTGQAFQAEHGDRR